MKALRGCMTAGALALGLWCASVVPAMALPVFSLSSSEAGGLVRVAVSASGMTDLYGYQFSLNFTPTVLHAVSVTEGPFLATGGATFFDGGTTDNVGGQVSFIFDTLLTAVSGVNGSGVLAVINFSALQFHQFASLSLSDVLAVDSNVNVLPVTATGLRLQVPEPSMLALLAIALVALTLVMRRQGRG
jgi:hypothetical protein